MGEFEDRLRRAEPRAVPTAEATERATARAGATGDARRSRRTLRLAAWSLAGSVAAVGVGFGSWWTLRDRDSNVEIGLSDTAAPASARATPDAIPDWGIESTVSVSPGSASGRVAEMLTIRGQRLGWVGASASVEGQGRVRFRVGGAAHAWQLREAHGMLDIAIFDAVRDLVSESADPRQLGLRPVTGRVSPSTDFLITRTGPRFQVGPARPFAVKRARGRGQIVRLPPGELLASTIASDGRQAFLRLRSAPVAVPDDILDGTVDGARMTLRLSREGRRVVGTLIESRRMRRLLVIARLRSSDRSASGQHMVVADGPASPAASGPWDPTLPAISIAIVDNAFSLPPVLLAGGSTSATLTRIASRRYGPERRAGGTPVAAPEAVRVLHGVDTSIRTARVAVAVGDVRVIVGDTPNAEGAGAIEIRGRLTGPTLCLLGPASPHVGLCSVNYPSPASRHVYGPVGPATTSVVAVYRDGRRVEGRVENGFFLLVLPRGAAPPEAIMALDATGRVIARRPGRELTTGAETRPGVPPSVPVLPATPAPRTSTLGPVPTAPTTPAEPPPPSPALTSPPPAPLPPRTP